MVSIPERGCSSSFPADTLLIAGPTAVGKSELAFRIAREVGGEIISVDSMQVYLGLDIGTAKPSEELRRQVPHHLIDVVNITEPFDAAQFVALARQAVNDIHERGRLPIFCGGTGLYFKAFLSGLGGAPAGNDILRTKLEDTPSAELLQELANSDPVTYNRIDRKNRRRVIRAVEVIRLTGKAYSAQKADWEQARKESGREPGLVCLTRETPELHQRINARVDGMFRAGLVAETEALLERGLAHNKTAMQAIGYRQVVEYLRGERSLVDTIELVKSRTRQFAKRQMTWFRKECGVKWIKLGNDIATDIEQVRFYATARNKNCLSSESKHGIVLEAGPVQNEN
jgi:tRNA dimethylallyltransferase